MTIKDYIVENSSGGCLSNKHTSNTNSCLKQTTNEVQFALFVYYFGLLKDSLCNKRHISGRALCARFKLIFWMGSGFFLSKGSSNVEFFDKKLFLDERLAIQLVMGDR